MTTDDATPDSGIHSGATVLGAVLVIACAVMACYASVLDGPFVFDDRLAITERAQRADMEVGYDGGMRLVGDWTIALNYQLGGLDPAAFRGVNIVIHAMSGVMLFLLTLATLRSPKLRDYFDGRAVGIAFAVALLWAVHPLQTQAVTYIIQRYESLMGLFYLTTLFFFALAIQSDEPIGWYVCGAITLALGGLTKEVMFTLPAVALLYDRAFFVKSWRELWGRWRWVGLMLLLAMPLVAPRVYQVLFSGASAGFSLQRVTVGEYLWSQPAVVLHYLRLAVWPSGQCFDYGWPVAESWSAGALPVLIISSSIAASLWLAWIRPAVGFLPLSFFLILAPTSSIIPINDLAVEHRMYLSCACVVAALVLAGDWLYQRRALEFTSRARSISGLVVVGVLVLILAGATHARNQVYQSSVALWRDVTVKQPGNPRGWANYGNNLGKAGDLEGAIAAFRQALVVDPEHPEARAMLAEHLSELPPSDPRRAEAVQHAMTALAAMPDTERMNSVVGYVLVRLGQAEGALPYMQRALELKPWGAGNHVNYAEALSFVGRHQEAAAHLQEAIKRSSSEHVTEMAQKSLRREIGFLNADATLPTDPGALQRVFVSKSSAEALKVFDAVLKKRPRSGTAIGYRAIVLSRLGRDEESQAAAAKCRELENGSAFSLYASGAAAAAAGRHEQAVEFYLKATSLESAAELWGSLADSYLALGNQEKALGGYQKAVEINPAHAKSHARIGDLLAKSDPKTAEHHYRLSKSFGQDNAYVNMALGNLLVRENRLEEAEQSYLAALQAKPGFKPAVNNLRAVQRLIAKRSQ